MLKQMREARKNQSGFTLIELLIVIVILGVLAGIVVFAVGAFNNDGKVAACKADVKNVEIAQEAFAAKNASHNYATSVAALVAAKYLKEPPDSSEGISTNTAGSVLHTCATS